MLAYVATAWQAGHANDVGPRRVGVASIPESVVGRARANLSGLHAGKANSGSWLRGLSGELQYTAFTKVKGKIMKPIWAFIVVGASLGVLMVTELIPSGNVEVTEAVIGEGRGQPLISPTPSESGVRLQPIGTAVSGLALTTYFDALDYIWGMESTKGLDPMWREEGSAGELGEYRLTPIFIEDVERICGFVIDPFDIDKCRYGIFIWLKHYAPSAGAKTVEQMCELFHLGPSGYREARTPVASIVEPANTHVSVTKSR